MNQLAIKEMREALSTAEAEFHDPLFLAMSPDIGRHYLETVPKESRRKLVAGLQSVRRWKNDDSGQIVNPAFEENNLDHTAEQLGWLSEIEIFYPYLWGEVCTRQIQEWINLNAMIVIHDCGEILVQDKTPTHSDFKNGKGHLHKLREARAAQLLLERHTPPELAAWLKDLYSRFDQRNEQDPIVMLGHTLDKGQSSQNVAKHIIPFTLAQNEALAAQAALGSMNRTLSFAEKLAAGLSPEARRELSEFLYKKVMRYFEDINHPSIRTIFEEMRGKFPLVLGNI